MYSRSHFKHLEYFTRSFRKQRSRFLQAGRARTIQGTRQRRKRKARPRRTAERRRQESTTSVAAGCTCITCRTLPSRFRGRIAHTANPDPRRKKAVSPSAAESGMEHRANECAVRCSVKFSNLQIPRTLLDFLE